MAKNSKSKGKKSGGPQAAAQKKAKKSQSRKSELDALLKKIKKGPDFRFMGAICGGASTIGPTLDYTVVGCFC